MGDPFAFPAALFQQSAAARRPPVGISACLQGQPVRYDGTDRALPLLALLATAVTLQPLCPEVAAGLGLPRPPVQLVVDDGAGRRVLGRDNPALDVTEALSTQADHAAATLARQDPPLCGWVWKSRSPSCGLGSTPLWRPSEEPGAEPGWRAVGHGDGMQVAAIRRTQPWLVMTEESELPTATAVARFVLACRLTAAALDRSVSLTALQGVHRTLLGTADSPTVTEGDGETPRQHYVTWLARQIMRGELAAAERLIARGASGKG